MFNRRTNILLDEEMYQSMNALVRKRKKSLSQLFREAARAYFGFGQKKANEAGDLTTRIMKGWKYLKNPKKLLDYKALVDEGRKY